MRDPEPYATPLAETLLPWPVPYVPPVRKRNRCGPGKVRASDMFAALDPEARWAFSQMYPAEAQRLERALLKRLRRGTP